MSAGIVEASEPKVSRFSEVFHRESCSPPSSPPPSPLGWHIAMAYRVRAQLERKSREILTHANPPNLSMYMRRMEGIIEEMESMNAALDHGTIPYNGVRQSFQLSMEMLFEISAELDRHLHRIRSSGPAITRQECSLSRRHREMRAHGDGSRGEQPGDRPSLWQRFASRVETLVSGICGKPRKSKVSIEGIVGGMASDPQVPGNDIDAQPCPSYLGNQCV